MSHPHQQVILIQNILKSNGYYSVNLEPFIKKNDNNTVDLVYNIDLGEVAKIKKISFIGDRVFRDNTLRNVILSDENKFWKFLTRNKFLDTNRINTDIIRLKKYYQNRGYFDIKIKSATAIITDENQFELSFNINSGNKFFFKNIQILNKDVALSVPTMSLRTRKDIYTATAVLDIDKESIDNFLLEKMSGENFNTFIVIKDTRKGPILSWVKVGVSDLYNVEIINGLNKGDVVYILPSKSLFDYQERFKERVSGTFSFG